MTPEAAGEDPHTSVLLLSPDGFHSTGAFSRLQFIFQIMDKFKIMASPKALHIFLNHFKNFPVK